MSLPFNTISLTLIQPDLLWEDVAANLESYEKMFKRITEPTAVILMPELFSTGFTMRSEEFAEPMEGKTMKWMAGIARKFNCEIAGSLIIEEKGEYYNRLVWMNPNGQYQHYSKRHLFRMSGENEHYSRGKESLTLLCGEVRIKPLICYDLRFPVWSRNQQDYDILVYFANWPAARRDVWETLLKARAIENQAYVIGINRVGRDGMDVEYQGETMVFNAKGQEIANLGKKEQNLQTIHLSMDDLKEFRKKFPVWKDADPFNLQL